MKPLYTILYLVLAIAIGVNFYMDYKRDAALKTAPLSATPAKVEEPSPFDKPTTDPAMNPSQKPVTAALTTISFEHTAYDFGSVESGPKYTTVFKFTNTGTADLFISAAEGSCGCTVPTWPKEPIKPGQTGEIGVEFDSKGRVGKQLKTVTVTSNTTPNKNVLTINCVPYLKTK